MKTPEISINSQSPMEKSNANLENSILNRITFKLNEDLRDGSYEGAKQLSTAEYEPTEIGLKILELFKEHEKKHGRWYGDTCTAWAHIECTYNKNAYELAKEKGTLPKDKPVTHFFAAPIPELGMKLWINGSCGNEEYEEKLVKVVDEAYKDMQELAEKIKKLGVDCVALPEK